MAQAIQTPEGEVGTQSASVGVSALREYVDKIHAGEKAQQAGRPDEAMALYEAAVSLRPGMFEAYFRLGNAAMQAGDSLKAFGAFQEALKLQPDNIQVLLRISEICYKLPDYEAAVAVLCEILMINENYLPALLALPEMLVKLERAPDAYNLLQAAIKRTPDVPELWVSAGIVAHTQNNFKDAITFYKEALRLSPDVDLAKENLANAERSFAAI
ncbi:MAG: tetratricopeptide repeat protein [Alphaproteobacteria bacterium]